MDKRKVLMIWAGGAALLLMLPGEENPRISMHPRDALPDGDADPRRTWRSLGHLAHHLTELARLWRPLAQTYLLRVIDPSFRERVMLVTAMANSCAWCSWAHSRFALLAGLDEDELKALAYLRPEDFPPKELAALTWVRSFMENMGDVPERVEEQFRLALSPRERRCVLASHKAMFVANLTANTAQALLQRLTGRQGEFSACELRP